MMKKNFISLYFIAFLFTSCWINPQSDNYTQVDDTLYFESFEEMESVVIPKINETFTDWHYNRSKFQKRYNKYLNNIDKNEENFTYLQNQSFSYAVKINSSGNKVTLSDNKTSISGKYFWITEIDGDSVVFYKE